MLIPFDDYPIHQTSEPLAHAGAGHPNQYDRFWFNGYNEDFYFALALGIYPNRGVIDAAFSVVADGVQRSVFASGRLPLDRTATRIGPITVEVVEPLRVSRITVDAPEQGLSAVLTAHARTPAIEEERTQRNEGTRRAWDATRATQMVRWSGTLSSRGTCIDLDGKTVYGTKDRSWGVRPVGSTWSGAPEPGADQLFFMWAPINFDDVALHYMVHEDAAGRSWAQTAAILPIIDTQGSVCDQSRIEHVAEVKHHLQWAPGLRRADAASLELIGRSGEPSTVELEPVLRFRMKGVGYFHPEWAHGVWRDELAVGGEETPIADLDVLRPDCIHIQQVVRATWGDKKGMGVLEQIVFGPYAPGGFTSALDGAGSGPAIS
ncbi:hypothetical protein ACWEOW_09820 [Monashia sp. NPDC004114]